MIAAFNSSVVKILPPFQRDSSSRGMIENSKKKERDDSHLPIVEKKLKPHSFVEKFSHNAINNGKGKRGRGGKSPKHVGTRKPILKNVDFNFQDVIVSPSKKLEKDEVQGMVGRKSVTFLKQK